MSTNTNFATFNPLSNQEGNGTLGTAFDDLSRGNTNFNVTNGSSGMAVTIATPPSGKWYCEFYLAGSVGNYAYVSYYPARLETPEVKKQWPQSTNTSWIDTGTVSVHSMGRYFYNGGYTDSGATSFTSGDIISIALDLDNGAAYFAKNNTFMNSGNPASGSSKTGAAPLATGGTPQGKEYLLAVGSAGSSGHNWTINAGQDSSFGGNKSTGTASAADANGYGDFYYSPPSGYLALCSANVPTSSDIDPAGDDGATENPTKQFNVITYTGNGSTQSISGLGFQPDLVWIKQRDGTNHGSLYDSNRGVTKRLKSSSTEQETTVTAGFTGFDSDGFSLGSATENNGNTNTYVAWCWRANGGTTSTNTDGTIATTLQVGKGFSIGTYTGTGTNATLGHGLGAVPDFSIFRERGTAGNWVVTSQKNMASNDHNLYLQLTNAESDGNYFQNTAMTSTVISIGTHADINGSTATYVMYNWINVDGLQRFGAWEGNNNDFGPFVYTGFRPRFVFVKSLDTTAPWVVWDSERSLVNPANNALAWNATNTESDYTGYPIDILSNGFKLVSSNITINASGTWIFGAWADVPFEFGNSHQG